MKEYGVSVPWVLDHGLEPDPYGIIQRQHEQLVRAMWERQDEEVALIFLRQQYPERAWLWRAAAVEYERWLTQVIGREQGDEGCETCGRPWEEED